MAHYIDAEKFEAIDRSFRSGREVGFKEGVESARTTKWSEEKDKPKNL